MTVTVTSRFSHGIIVARTAMSAVSVGKNVSVNNVYRKNVTEDCVSCLSFFPALDSGWLAYPADDRIVLIK